MKKRKPPILLVTILVVLFGVVGLIVGPLTDNSGSAKGHDHGEEGHEEEHADHEGHDQEAEKKPEVKILTAAEITQQIKGQKMQARQQAMQAMKQQGPPDPKFMESPIVLLPPKPKVEKDKKPELERTGGMWYDPETQQGSH